MAKTKPDKDLYARLRENGLRKKTAKRVSEALPSKGSKSPAAAQKVAAMHAKRHVGPWSN